VRVRVRVRVIVGVIVVDVITRVDQTDSGFTS
jgi:hypothetical protein